MIIMSKASAERIAEILNEKSTMENKENPVLEVKDGSIDFENVSFSYSHHIREEEKDVMSAPVLSNINLHINSGETVGIMSKTPETPNQALSSLYRDFLT